MMVFFIILFIIFLIIMAIRNLNIQFEIAKLNINNVNEKIAKEFIIVVKLRIFNKITIFKTVIDEKKMTNINRNLKTKIAEKLDREKLKRAINLNNILSNRKQIKEQYKRLNIKIEKFILDLRVGTEDIMITTFFIPAMSTLISIILSKFWFNSSLFELASSILSPPFLNFLLYHNLKNL